MQSSNNAVRIEQFGSFGDNPAAVGDFDGDGKGDIAIWRDGVYYIRSASSGNLSLQYFGTAGDKVIASAFIQ